MLTIDRIDHIVLTVENIDRACAFYEKLGMTRVSFGNDRVGVSFGSAHQQRINFHEVGRVIQPRAARATVGSADFCLVTSYDMQTLLAHLSSQNISIELGPVGRNGSLGPMQSVYVRDPDNNLVEISTYAPG